MDQTAELPLLTVRNCRQSYHKDASTDLVVLEDESGLSPVKAMLEALNSRRFAREINQLCAYDTDQMGKVIAQSH